MAFYDARRINCVCVCVSQAESRAYLALSAYIAFLLGGSQDVAMLTLPHFPALSHRHRFQLARNDFIGWLNGSNGKQNVRSLIEGDQWHHTDFAAFRQVAFISPLRSFTSDKATLPLRIRAQYRTYKGRPMLRNCATRLSIRCGRFVDIGIEKPSGAVAIGNDFYHLEHFE